MRVTCGERRAGGASSLAHSRGAEKMSAPEAPGGDRGEGAGREGGVWARAVSARAAACPD